MGLQWVLQLLLKSEFHQVERAMQLSLIHSRFVQAMELFAPLKGNPGGILVEANSGKDQAALSPWLTLTWANQTPCEGVCPIQCIHSFDLLFLLSSSDVKEFEKETQEPSPTLLLDVINNKFLPREPLSEDHFEELIETRRVLLVIDLHDEYRNGNLLDSLVEGLEKCTVLLTSQLDLLQRKMKDAFQVVYEIDEQRGCEIFGEAMLYVCSFPCSSTSKPRF
jgi:hypothetical protein